MKTICMFIAVATLAAIPALANGQDVPIPGGVISLVQLKDFAP